MPFHETFCIGAVESGLAGCRRVMADWGALPERSIMPPSAGMMISSKGEDDENDLWVNALVEAMTYKDDHGRPYPIVQPYSWAEIAKRDFLPLMKLPAYA